MSLSNELISQFVKATKEEKRDDAGTTVYGTIRYDGKTYVQLDGSDVYTPVETTADTADGNRVTVLIKDHTAIVTGNLSTPALNTSSEVIQGLEYEVTRFDEVVANKVDTSLLVAEQARIDTLVADNATIKNNLTALEADIGTLEADNVTINDTLAAAKGDIDDLKVKKLNASDAEITYAKIADLNATNAEIYNLTGVYGDFQVLTTSKFAAVDANIVDLNADKLDAGTADITYAKIADLDAIEADIVALDADVANIDTLIFGSASGNTIQTSFANAVIAQLGNAKIKSAMIDTIAASKITSGDIITNNVRVKSQNGLLLISDETVQISDNTRVRVQIGKDASNDYSINVWDAEGNLMFSKGGITDSAIKDAIIRNDMVSDTANIAAHKLDIDSLFEEINGSTNTIKSTKVYLDDKKQTLNVAFTSLETDVSDLGETVSSHGTQISTIQGQISSKIWQQDIENAESELNEKTEALSTKYSTLEQNVNSFKSTVSSTYATKTALTSTDTKAANAATAAANAQADIDNLTVGGRNLVTGTSDEWTNVDVARYSATVRNRVHCSKYGLAAGDEFTYSIELNPLVKSSLRARLDFYSASSGEDGKSSHFGNTIVKGQNGKSYLMATVPEGVEYIALMIGNYDSTNETTTTSEQYRSIKLEKGNRSTDWTPAPEDVQSGIDAAQAAAEAAQAAANRNASDMASLVVEINADVASLQTQIDGSITTWFYEVEPTTSNVPAVNWTTTELRNNHLGDLYYDTITGYCYRWQVKNNTYSWQRITDTDITKALADAQTAQDTADQKRRVFYSQPTAPYDKGDLWVQGSSGDILRCQTAKIAGQSYAASDWIAASKYTDDTVANAANNKAAAAQTAASNAQACVDALSTRVTAAETTISQNTEAITLRATKTEVATAKTEAISSANTNTTNLLKSYSTTTQMNSAIEQKANSITSSVSTTYATKTALTSAVDSLEIGGRNLITNAHLFQTGLKNGGEFTYENTKTGTAQIFANLQLEPGDYTYSLYMKRSADLDVARIRLYKNNVTVGYYTNNSTDGNWGIVKIPITVTSVDDVYGSQVYNHNFGEEFDPSVSVKKIKLERGDKATDWTPAPEDMATSEDNDIVNAAAEAAQETATTAETLVKQLTDSISMLVTDGNGTSLMTQTEDGWTFSTADIQQHVSDIAQSLDSLTSNVGDNTNAVDVLKRAVADLGELAEYVKIGTYESEPCIELGESDSEFKMRITNTRILFMEGSNVVAHISNQSLHIKKAVIEEELQQGDFVWQIRSNGNLGLIWKGVGS